MKQERQGFLLVEIMVAIVLVTFIVSILIKYQVQCLGWQTDAQAMMQAIEESLRIVYDNNNSARLKDTRLQRYPLTSPSLHEQPACLSLDFSKKIQIEIYEKTWIGFRGSQHCVMPAVVVAQGEV